MTETLRSTRPNGNGIKTVRSKGGEFVMKRLIFYAVRLTPVVLIIIMLGGGATQAALVAKWNFNDLNDSSDEDKENNTLILRKGAKLENGTLVLRGGEATKPAAIVKAPFNSEIHFWGEDKFTVWIRCQILTPLKGEKGSFALLTTSVAAEGGWLFKYEDAADLHVRVVALGEKEGGEKGQGALVARGQILNINGKTDNNRKMGDGRFHDYAWVRSEGVIGFVWIDGDLDGRGRLLGQTLRIWEQGGQEVGPIDGIIDEVRIYDTALEDQDLDAIAPDPAPGGNPPGAQPPHAVHSTDKLATLWGKIKGSD